MGPIKVGLFLGLISVFTVLANANTQQRLNLDEASAVYLLQEAIDTINRVQLQDNIVYPINGVPVADKCTSFLTKEQVIGSNGKKIYESFLASSPDFPNLVHGGTLNNYCPNYKEMLVEEKGLVWVLVLTMMAHFESSCNPAAAAQGPNGTASGFYQLHKDKEAMYDGRILDYCKKGSSTAENSVHQCSLSMLQFQFETQGNILFSPKSYWDVLRPNGESQKAKHIRSAIQKMQICNPRTT